MDNSQKKSGGLSKIIIGIIIGIFIGAVAFFLVNKFILNPDKDTTKTNNDIKKVESNENVIKEVKDTALIEELRKELINEEGSLYYSEKVDTSVANDKRLIAFSILRYMDENNMKMSFSDAVGKNGIGIQYTISKQEISNYMKKLYNTDVDYSYPKTEVDEYLYQFGCSSIEADDDNYLLVMYAKSCGSKKRDTKYIKAEEDSNNIYIYDNYVSFYRETFYSFDVVEDDRSLNESVYSCGGGVETKCPTYDDAEFMDYFYNNYSDKINTFKHTFKKVDGNYYYVSTEIVK